MGKLKIGIVGSGFTGEQHLDALRRIPNVEVVAMADANIDALRQKQDRLSINRIYSDYKEMIDKENLDVLHNCTPNAIHFEINQYALAKGIHVYCEKPLAITIEQGEKLIELAAKNNLANGVNFNYRNNVMVQEMKARMNKDAGRCLLIHGTYVQDWLLYEEDYNWRLNSKECGPSRAVADIGSHWFDIIQNICGQKIIGVNSSLITAHPTRKKLKSAENVGEAEYETISIDTEDAAFVVIKLEDGTLGNVVISQVSAGYKNVLFVSADCEKYSMRWDQQAADRLVIGRRDGGEETLFADIANVSQEARLYATLPAGHPVGWTDALRNGLKQYYDSIWNQTYQNPVQSYATFADGVAIMKIVEACLESNRKGEWVYIK